MRKVEPTRKSLPNKTCKALIDLSSLLSILKTIYQKANETIRHMRPAQLFATMNTDHDPSLNTNTTHSNSQEREEILPWLEEGNIEDISIYFLCTYSTHPNWKQIVSTCNDYGQTLAHIVVTLGYFRLLQHLFKWKIDLNVVDSMGLSALHYAYLYKQEECARFLIHSGVDRFILDDLGRSPADLDPSLEVKLGSIMDIDSADGALPIEYDTEMPDEAEKFFTKHFLTQQWMGESKGERRGEVPLSRCQSQETSSPLALDSMGVPCDGSSSLVARIPEERSTPVVAEEMDSEALIETAASTHSVHPPSSISEISPQTQENNSPSDTGQHPVSPLGGAITTPDPGDTQIYLDFQNWFEIPGFARRELSVDGVFLGTSEDTNKHNGAKEQGLLQHSSSSPASTSVARQRSISGPATSQDGGRMEVVTIRAYDGDLERAAYGFPATPTLTLLRGRTLPVRFEPNITNLKARLIAEGVAQEVVDLCGEVFKGGVTNEALERRLTRSQCEKYGLRDGKVHLILFEKVERTGGGWPMLRCRVCPRNGAKAFKNHRDALRHLRKDHFGLSFDCCHW